VPTGDASQLTGSVIMTTTVETIPMNKDAFILRVSQTNLLALTGAVFHDGGFAILIMTAMTTLMSKDALQV